MTIAQNISPDSRFDSIDAVSELDAPDSQAAQTFKNVLYAGTASGAVETLSPEQMLQQQAKILTLSVGVDLGAKIAGSAAQTVNKLANMT
ncbi:EscI/YscI/HrpB family type III secretion system inner rod protein [Candidatus Symbiopectobacterium sp. 'North America']|uniref:type III secretion system inner rod subunit SctI n=1 Tax=Candidatus Symbiopectobacterium sp. 'North America' TaxID=2794574 RepID=UPI0018C8F1A0|nr:type III secretion system inner rod subunit SctI [Candidatus Symbiopectobacterium sp. 'North America']MBG6245246.1 EscI/YscI/HrpB family type III secretion system inner rod protein [Candidatus Symbiopectobacterium sp. 'North America']